jgi:ribosomal protein S27AE
MRRELVNNLNLKICPKCGCFKIQEKKIEKETITITETTCPDCGWGQSSFICNSSITK